MAPAAAAMAMIARLVLVAASAGAAAKPLQHLDPTQEVETRLAALLPTLSVEQLMTQTLHLWTKVNMDMINETYSKTGVGAAYSNHPTGDSSCDTDPACNLKARLALNRELMKTCGIPVTFVAESLHSPWITQGVIMPMPVALGSSWNNSLLTEVGAAIAAVATACASTRGFSPEINVCTDPRFGRTQVRSNSSRPPPLLHRKWIALQLLLSAAALCCLPALTHVLCCSLLSGELWRGRSARGGDGRGHYRRAARWNGQRVHSRAVYPNTQPEL